MDKNVEPIDIKIQENVSCLKLWLFDSVKDKKLVFDVRKLPIEAKL